MVACNVVVLDGGCGSMACGTAPAGALGPVEILGAVSELPDFKGFDPLPGRPLEKLQHVRFEVTDDTGELLIVFVTATFGDGVTECVWDGQGFTPRYVAGSSVSTVQCGSRFTIRRAGGWVRTPLRVDAIAIDADGNVNRMRNAFS